MKMRKLKKGFTLVELVVVIAVIAVLAAVSVGAYFGVTESAKNSAATSYLKQIKDMWMVFSISENYNEEITEQDNAEYFAAEHIPYNGLTVDVNYRMVDYYANGNVNSQNTEPEKAVLFKVESEYPTWFIVKDKQVVQSSEVYKNEEKFVESLQNCEFVSDPNNDFSADSFYLVSMYDETNSDHKVRGYKYVEYIVNTYDIDKNLTSTEPTVHTFSAKESLYHETKRISYDPEAKIEIESYPDNELLWNYFNEDFSESFVTSNVVEIDNTFSKKAVIDGVEMNRGYVCDTIVVNQVSNIKAPSTENYPVLYVNRSSGSNNYKFYSSLDSLIEEGLIDNNNASTPSFIFVNNTKLSAGNNFTVKSNHKFVVDFLPTVLEEGNVLSVNLNEFDKIDSGIHNRVTNNSLLNERVQMSQLYKGQVDYKVGDDPIYTFELGESDQRSSHDIATPKKDLDGNYVSNVKSTFVIEKGASLNFEKNSYLFSEALVSYAGPQSGTGILDYSYIENNGTINLNDGSYLRSFGRIGGTGLINMNKGSNVYDLFKLTSFFGGTISVNMFTNGIFPFNDYVFDNIHCEINMYSGSTYSFISTVYSDNRYNEFLIKYIAPLDNNDDTTDNALFMYDAKEENCLVAKMNYIDTEVVDNQEITRKVKKVEYLNSDVHVRNVQINLGTVSVVKINVNSALYNFPISNTDLVVDTTASLNIGENSTLKQCTFWRCKKMVGGRSFNLEFLPSSSLTVEGKLNLSASTGETHDHLSYEYSQTDIPVRGLLDTTDAEVLLGVKPLNKTELSFQNFTLDQLNGIIGTFSTPTEGLELNIYMRDIFEYYRDNISCWSQGREMFNLIENSNDPSLGVVNYAPEITDDNLKQKIIEKVDVYAANNINDLFVANSSKKYNFKYQTAFKNGISSEIVNILMNKPKLGVAKSFELIYSIKK